MFYRYEIDVKMLVIMLIATALIIVFVNVFSREIVTKIYYVLLAIVIIISIIKLKPNF